MDSHLHFNKPSIKWTKKVGTRTYIKGLGDKVITIFLLWSFGRSLSPYDKSCIKTSFKCAVYPDG